ncbi:alanine racemase [Halocynthiibacter namhaensis]|uniref:alanine racemase n=1 Tax=Halocynthiibacter namhaensis TaxID=1290553 RepID=UPI0005792A8F|nr:alanine racemase [Halocynthiibacter namhaensis]
MGTGILTIDPDSLAKNWQALNGMSSQAVETTAVVKADGYGLGAGNVARRLMREGVTKFFVATTEEGVALRRDTGDAPNIYILSGHMLGDTDMLRDARLTPMLNSLDQITRHFASLPAAPFGVQLDSGMNRLGLEPADWTALKSEVLARGPVLLMSHLACSDTPENPQNAEQLACFRAMTDGVDVPRSLAATGGILLGADYHFDLVRPGVGLYGGLPFRDASPVVQLSLPIIQTRDVQPGEYVGYGNGWKADKPTKVATLAAGYADGLIRAMGGQSTQVFAAATPCEILGRVSMDMLTVDVTHLENIPESLDILCDHQTIDDLADKAGTIGYEILTNLGARYTRHLKEETQ